MKKLLYRLLAVSIIFSACEKENHTPNSGNTNNTSSSIIGSWDVTEYLSIYDEGYFLSNGSKIITNNEQHTQLIGAGQYILIYQWTFFDNGYMSMYSYNIHGETDGDTMSYLKSGDALVIDGEMGSIITLSSSKLTFQIELEDTWSENDTIYFSDQQLTFQFDRSSFTTDNLAFKKISPNKEPFFKTFINRKR